jgi:hypothetical protein
MSQELESYEDVLYERGHWTYRDYVYGEAGMIEDGVELCMVSYWLGLL